MLDVRYSAKFKRDWKAVMKSGYDARLFEEIVVLLREQKPLPKKNKDHALTGNWINHRECHITPNWLLVYRIQQDILVLTLTRTGTHSELFDK